MISKGLIYLNSQPPDTKGKRNKLKRKKKKTNLQ